jgi:hypothetical protein
MEPPKPIDPNYIEDWPQGRNRIETAAHVHAFGMIGLNASMLEEILLLLLLTYLPMGQEEAIRLTTRLNNRERADWLAALMNAETNPEFADHVNHGILCCNICFDNRNMLIHSLYTGTDDVTANMRLSKRAKNAPLRELRFEVSIHGLRKIADEIGDTVNYLIDLWFLKTHRSALAQHLPLLVKPPRPDKLTIPPPQEGHAIGKRQPES